MYIKDISFQEPEKNILLDDVLLQLAEQSNEDREVLRFWESPQVFIVLGRTGKPQEDIYLDRCRSDRIPILRRSSGGGTVVQGPGCLNYSLILSKQKHPVINDLRKSYQYIIGKVIDSLGKLRVSSVFMPISDIALAGTQKKFSGNAQKRGRRYILHHGTLLYGFDLSLIERYLRLPRDIPEYRRGRAHLDFVDNLNLSASDIKEALKKMYPKTATLTELDSPEQGSLAKALQERNVRENVETLQYGQEK